MKILSYILGMALAASAMASAHALNMPADLPRFSAHDLNERPITLPDESPSALTLYIFAYQREQQSEVDSALEAVAPLFEAFSLQQFDYIEVPTIEDYGSLFRWYVDNGMRSGIVEQDTRARVVTYYTDMEAFQAAYGITDLTTITSVLADRDGTIHWTHSGQVEAEQAAALQRKVTDILQNNPGKRADRAL